MIFSGFELKESLFVYELKANSQPRMLRNTLELKKKRL